MEKDKGGDMNDIKIFENKEFGEIRTVEVERKIYFVASDVARALGYTRPADAVSQHCRYTVKHSIPHPQNLDKQMEVNVIPEGDMYRLITHSKLESAERFESWVFDEVLPSIRQTGTYSMLPCPLNPQIASSVAELGRVTERIMRKQGSPAYKIAETFKGECEQFGIQLPADFVMVPEYIQLQLSDYLKQDPLSTGSRWKMKS